MQKYHRILVFVLMFLFTFGPSKGTHMMGADMSYQCLGNGKYKIIAKLYRDCQGVSLGSVEFKAFAGVNGGNGCGTVTPTGFTRTGIRDVTTRCSTASSPCNPRNTFGTGKGVEEHTFECTVDFNSAPLNGFVNKSTCCDVTFYVHECCRNGAITTGPASNQFYSSCMINICNLKKTVNKCNTSPQLTNDPVGFICCNIPWYYNNGALDSVDFDSISYRLINGIQGLPNTSVTYSSPFTPQYPMTPFCVPPTTIKCTPNPGTNPPRGFFFDTANGDIIVTPTKCDEVPIIVIEQTEWRPDSATGKYIVIGRTRRDMQLWVLDDCGYNKPPVINGPFSWIICEGDKICKKIKITDETFTPYQTTPDTVLAKWNGGIPGATFKVVDKTKREKEYEFCWQTKRGDARDVSYSFTVQATDQHCTPPVISIRSFKVKVQPRAEDQRVYTQLKCGRFAMAAKFSTSFKGSPNVQWSVRDSTGKKELFYSGKKTDTMNYYYSGKYIIKHTVNNPFNCPTIYSDTVILTPPPKVVIANKDSFSCLGSTFKMKGNIVSGKPAFKYRWSTGDTLDNITIKNFSKDTTLLLFVTDGDGCKFSDTSRVLLKPLPVINLGPDQRICTYETQKFDGQNNDTVKYLWSTGDTTRIVYKHIKGFYWVKITDKTFKCSKIDTVQLFVNDTVVSDGGPNQSICHKDTFFLVGSHRPSQLTSSYLWIGLGTNKNYKIKSDISKGTYSYVLKTTITQLGHTCDDLDTIFIRVKPLPKISWSPTPLKPQCYSYGSIWMEPFVVKPNKLGVYDIWSGDVNKKTQSIVYGSTPYNGRFLFQTSQIDNSLLQGGKSISTKVYVKFNDTNGCSNIDSTVQKIYGTPIIQLTPKILCQDIGILMMDNVRTKPVSKNGLNMKWDVLFGPSGIDTSTLLTNISTGSIPNIKFSFGTPQQDNYQGQYKFKLNVKDILTGCDNTDSVAVTIIPEPTIKLTTPPESCVNSGTVLNVFDYIYVNGVKQTSGNIYIKDVSGNKTDPRVSTNISSGLFKTSMGPGSYNIQYSTSQMGCSKFDSLFIVVHDTSNLIVGDTTLCSSGLPLDILKMPKSNQGGSLISYPSGRFFTGNPTPYGYQKGPYSLMIVGHTQYDCKDTEYSKVVIINQPRVKFVRPIEGCDTDTVGLNLDTLNISGGAFTWDYPVSVFGPTLSKFYIPTAFDTFRKFVDVRVSYNLTSPKICQDVWDTVKVLIHHYPQPNFTWNDGCEPRDVLFTLSEKSGVSPSLLTYQWNVNGNPYSTAPGSINYLFTGQGKYPVSLFVQNNEGQKKCGRVVVNTVNIYPKPNGIFTTDPLIKTTVALPKFRTFNSSSVSQNPFSTSMTYNWSWGKTFKVGGDTLKEPSIIFGKDTGTYWIKLYVTTDKNCKDTVTRTVIIGPDIIVFIPDGFTPDGSGPNENNTFIPVVLNNKTFNMSIYNRWGEKMYETNDLSKGWDGNYAGKLSPQGVYVYKILVTSMDGDLFQYKGTVTLLR